MFKRALISTLPFFLGVLISSISTCLILERSFFIPIIVTISMSVLYFFVQLAIMHYNKKKYLTDDNT